MDILRQILAAVLKSLGIQVVTNALVAAYSPPVGRAVVETSSYLVQDKVNAIEGTVDNAGYGNFALLAAINSLQTTLLAAIGTPQQAGSPVTLPTVPPSGYGANDTADAVWNFGFTFGGDTPFAVDVMQLLWDWVGNAGQFLDVPKPDNFPFVLQSNWANTDVVSYHHPVQLDVGTILSTDATVHDWVTRQYPTVAWLVDGNGFTYAVDLTHPQSSWQIPLNDAQFRQLQIALGLVPQQILNLKPIWPGVAGVTFVGSVTTTTPTTLSGPMDGVVVLIVGTPPTPSQFPFGGETSYRHVGAAAFMDDNGDTEQFQLVGFQQGLVMPLNIAHPTNCRISVQPGWTLDVHSFIVNP